MASRLGILTGGSRDFPQRQRTLRATLDWSHDLLAPKEKVLFARLAVFVGGTLDGIEAVCDPEGDLDELGGVESLVKQNLVLAHEGMCGEPRLGMLETIHEYALARLAESGEAGGVQEASC